MSIKNFIHLLIISLVLFILGLLPGCKQDVISVDTPTPQEPFPSLSTNFTNTPLPVQSLVLNPTKTITLIPSGTINFTHTPMPSLTISPNVTQATRYQLTFISNQHEGYDGLYAIDISCLDSNNPCFSNPKLLFEVPKKGVGPRVPITSYSWSPDGQQIAIDATGIEGHGDIFVGTWDGRNWRNLTISPSSEWNPIWSSDGKRTAYLANPDPSKEAVVFSTNPDGKDLSQILNLPKGIYSIAYFSLSPDGKQIAFTANVTSFYYQLFTSNLDGSELRQLTNTDDNYYSPAFSEDGLYILCVRGKDNPDKSSLVMIKIDSGEVYNITMESQNYQLSPSWSPVGNWIAFSSDYDGNYNIYLIKSDGTNLIEITKAISDDFSPSWRVIKN